MSLLMFLCFPPPRFPALTITASASQTSFFPCAPNVISITLTSNVDIYRGVSPLMAAAAVVCLALVVHVVMCICICVLVLRLTWWVKQQQVTCVNSDDSALFNASDPKITVTGLENYQSHVRLDTETAPAPFGWDFLHNNDTFGNFVITPNQTVLGNTNRTINIRMTNDPTNRDPFTLTIGINTFTSSPANITYKDDIEKQPGYIVAPYVKGGGTQVHQSSDNPCAANTITVSIVTNVPVSFLLPVSLYLHAYPSGESMERSEIAFLLSQVHTCLPAKISCCIYTLCAHLCTKHHAHRCKQYRVFVSTHLCSASLSILHVHMHVCVYICMK